MNLLRSAAHSVPTRVSGRVKVLVATGCLSAALIFGSARAQHIPSVALSGGQASVAQTKRDSMTITLQPMARTEVKLEMTKGQRAQFRWKSNGANVIFNLHGEGPNAPGGKAHVYKRGESPTETGEIVAVFDGVHGWSWRNTSDKPVTVSVTAWGQFQKLKQM